MKKRRRRQVYFYFLGDIDEALDFWGDKRRNFLSTEREVPHAERPLGVIAESVFSTNLYTNKMREREILQFSLDGVVAPWQVGVMSLSGEIRGGD